MLILFALACQQLPVDSPSWCQATGPTLGTTYSVKWAAPDCDGVGEVVKQTLDQVDQQMSTWREDSELTAIRAGGRVHVSADTLSVVRDGLALADATQGAFDPTVQPLMEVWGFHNKTRGLNTPSTDELQSARDQVGWERVQVGVDAQGPWVNAGGTALDLSSIAKGHAVDRVSLALSTLGHASHMVEVGGEVRVAGEGPSGLWALGVDAPVEGSVPGRNFAAVVRLTNLALATSGNYRNLVEIDGRKVHHTMDPRTGQPAVSDVASASVIAPTCREADALATAVMVLGSEAGLALLEQRSDVEGLILVSEEGLVQRKTSGMKAFLSPP